MITTSVSLPNFMAAAWRSKQRQIMRCAVRTLRLTMRKTPIRRGVSRYYNRQAVEMSIVTTRFTEAEYDTLHFAAASMRVSVSYLVYLMVKLWLKPIRQMQQNQYLTNYELFPTNWGANCGLLTESLFFWPKNWQNRRQARVAAHKLTLF